MKEVEQVDYLVKTAWQEINKMYTLRANRFNASVATAFALLTIHPKEGTATSKMGPKMGIAPTSISRTLLNLENLKLVERHDNPNDKRGTIIKLTPEGLKMRDISRETILGFNEFVKSKITDEEFDTFVNVIQKISQGAEEYKNSSNE